MKPKKVDDAVRLEACKQVLIEHRAKMGARAAYELYGILFGNQTAIDRVDHAPTSGDFAPLIGKKRIGSLFKAYDLVVEFRGAWGKTQDQVKVVAWEADANA